MENEYTLTPVKEIEHEEAQQQEDGIGVDYEYEENEIQEATAVNMVDSEEDEIQKQRKAINAEIKNFLTTPGCYSLMITNFTYTKIASSGDLEQNHERILSFSINNNYNPITLLDLYKRICRTFSKYNWNLFQADDFGITFRKRVTNFP